MGMGFSYCTGSSSRLRFDHDGVLVGVRLVEGRAEFIRHHVLAHIANAQIERLLDRGFRIRDSGCGRAGAAGVGATVCAGDDSVGLGGFNRRASCECNTQPHTLHHKAPSRKRCDLRRAA